MQLEPVGDILPIANEEQPSRVCKILVKLLGCCQTSKMLAVLGEYHAGLADTH